MFSYFINYFVKELNFVGFESYFFKDKKTQDDSEQFKVNQNIFF